MIDSAPLFAASGSVAKHRDALLWCKKRMALALPPTITLVFSLLVAIVVLATLAARLRLPYAILLVLGSLLFSFLPGLSTITLDPALLQFLFLPPLIYSSSWFEFRTTLRAILLLSVSLELVTTTVVAVGVHTLLGLPWPVAFVLGAVVSPTDAVAAFATAKYHSVADLSLTYWSVFHSIGLEDSLYFLISAHLHAEKGE